MKYKLIKLFSLILIFSTFYSCSKSIEYKFLNKEKLSTNCDEINSDLTNEAYYSFREDIAEYAKNNVKTERIEYQYSLALFIVNGASGEADYKNIISAHTQQILKLLQQENQLWNNDNSLNYHSNYINCLIENIKNSEIKNAILFYRDKKLSKNELVEIYRLNIRETATDTHFAMFIAFESYYQFLNKLEY